MTAAHHTRKPMQHPAWLAAVGALSVVVAAGTAGAQPAASGETLMYLGNKQVGSISADGLIDCDAYAGGTVRRARNGRAIGVHFIDGVLAGYAVLRARGRWQIYDRDGGTRLVGSTVRRTAVRWDVLRKARIGEHVIGHTQGPSGPEAATAFLTICGFGG
jgi:hypothetical protein